MQIVCCPLVPVKLLIQALVEHLLDISGLFMVVDEMLFLPHDNLLAPS